MNRNNARFTMPAAPATPSISAAPLNILLVDDHTLVRDGLEELLQPLLPASVFGHARTSDEAIEQMNNYEWDAVLLDLGLPGAGGLEVLKEFRQAQPKAKMLVLTMHSEVEYAIAAMKAGAAAFLTKDATCAEIVTAFKKVLAGETFVTPALAEHLVVSLEKSQQKLPHEKLSKRELEVFRGIIKGTDLTSIGRELSLSVKTISTYRARIRQKTGFQSNAEMIRYAVKQRIS